MARLLRIVWAIGFGVGLVSDLMAGEIKLGAKKAHVLVEVQQIPLESFGTPADVPKRERWSTWLVRVTNRSKYAAFVQSPGIDPHPPPPPAPGFPRTIPPPPRPSPYSYTNWRLFDGNDKWVGKAIHTVEVPFTEPHTGSRWVHVMDYLIAAKTPLASPLYELAGQRKPLSKAEAALILAMFDYGSALADGWQKLQERAAQVPDRPRLEGSPERHTPAVWPGEAVWGYLVFYQSVSTRSTKLTPRGNLGKGVTWALTVNPGLLDELTRPAEEGEQ